MINKLTIHNYRSCENVVVDSLGELTLFVGKNGVGKSNILKATEWCAKACLSENSSLSTDWIDSADVEMNVTIDGDIFNYRISCELSKNSKNESAWVLKENLTIGKDCVPIFSRNAKELLVDEDIFYTGQLQPAISFFTSVLPNHKHHHKVEAFAHFMRSVRYYPIIETEIIGNNELDHLFLTQENYDHWKKTGRGRNYSIEVTSKLLDLYLNDNNRYEEILALLGPNGIDLISGVTIDSFDVPKAAAKNSAEIDLDNSVNKFYYFLFHSNGSKAGFRLQDLSFGTRKLIRLVTDFLYDDTNVFLLEQPEDGIHCGLLQRLFQLLEAYSFDRQCLLASHSADLINYAQPQSIRLVSMDGGVTSVKALSKNELEKADNYKNWDGTLSEFIKSLQEY